MGKSKPFTVYNCVILADGSKLIMSKVDNAGTPDKKGTIYITPEERQIFNDTTMERVSQIMSPYYDENGVFYPNGYGSSCEQD